MTRDYTFDLVYQTWQTSLFPKKEVNEIDDPLLLPLPAQKDDHADLVNQHVAQEQTLPEETAVDNKQLPQQDMENKQYQWIVMDQAFIGTVEGLYKLLYQSDFVHQYLTVMVQCQGIYTSHLLRVSAFESLFLIPDRGSIRFLGSTLQDQK